MLGRYAQGEDTLICGQVYRKQCNDRVECTSSLLPHSLSLPFSLPPSLSLPLSLPLSLSLPFSLTPLSLPFSLPPSLSLPLSPLPPSLPPSPPPSFYVTVIHSVCVMWKPLILTARPTSKSDRYMWIQIFLDHPSFVRHVNSTYIGYDHIVEVIFLAVCPLYETSMVIRHYPPNHYHWLYALAL